MAARQRPEAFAWSPPQVEFQGGVIAEYAHYFDPKASSAQPRLEFFTVVDVFSKPSSALTSPQQSVPCEYKFNELSWSPSISETHPSGIIFGGTENGTVVFLDAHQLVHNSSLSVISSRRDHQGHVLSVDFSSDARWAISAGAAAQLLLWDLSNLATPFSPGAPNFTDQVRRVRWNRSMANIVASLSSQRGSLWDMRHPGGPILEFAEIGSGCDWADLCWKPDDSSTLIVASQLALAPGVQKWDLRYPTAPVNEYHVHDRGVTAIDWHKKDPRMVVSAGNDGFARVFNPDNGEILGAVQLQQNDRARAITWSEARPDLLAIQYHQHATEFRSIETGSENATVGPLQVSMVPQWVSAAPVGSSFAMGGRMATHYRQWDEAKQIWRYTVEVKKLPVNEALYQSAMELQNAQDANTLGQYCEDRAHETNDRNLQVLWTFLAALSNKQGRREFVRILGFGGNEARSKDSRASRTSVTSNEVTQLTNIMSSLNNSSPRQNGERAHSVSDDESSTAEEFARQADLNWSAIGGDTWSLVDVLVDDGEETVVEKLLAQKDYATAFMLARDNANLMHRITEKYIAEELAAPQRLLSLIATDGFDQLVDTFPREQWSRLLALVLARADRARLVHTMRKIAAKWLAEGEQDAVHAAFAAVLAQDVDLLLASNRSYSSEERAKQAMVLRSLTGADVNEEFEKLLYTYCEDLIAGGVSDAAWRILSKVNTKDERLLSLRHDLFLICGGEERTMNKEPENPRSRQVQSINDALHPSVSQQRNPVFTPSAAVAPLHHHSRPAYPPAAQPSGMTPTFSNSSYGGYVPTPAPPMPGTPPLSSYQSGYYAPTPPPPVPMPPPVPGYQPAAAASMYTSQPTAVPGFSQAPAPLPPPPVAPPNVPTGSSYGYPASHAQQSFAPPVPAPTAQAYSQSSSRRSTVSPSGGSDEIRAQGSAHGWNDPPALAARKPTPTPAPVLEINWKPLEQAPVSIPNGLPGAISGTPIRPPSSASSHHPPEHKEIPQVTLTPEDQAIMDRLQQLVDAILAVNRTPMAMHKAEEAKNRLGCELAPRLANGKLSLTIRQLLWQCAEQSSHGNYRGATAICGQMVRTGGDFVEVSAFLPALKSLFSLAQSTFAR